MEPEQARAVGVLAFVHGLVHATILSIPVLLLPWAQEFRLTPLEQGVYAAVAYASFGAGGLPLGARADRRGADGQLRASVVAMAISLAAIALAPDRWTLVAALAALGLSASAYHPSALALLSRTIPETGRAMGWHGMGGSAGIAAGPAAVVGVLAVGGASAWRLVPLAFAAIAVAGAVLLRIGQVRDAPPARGAVVPRFRAEGFSAVLAVYAFAGVAYWGTLTFLPRFLGSSASAGPLYAVGLAAGAAGQILFGYRAEAPRPERTLLAASAAAGGVLALTPWLPAATWFALVPAFGFLLFGLEPLQNTLVTTRVPSAGRGRAFGATFLAVFGLGSVGAVLAGAFVEAGLTYPALFGVLMASLVASGVCAVASARP